MICNRIMYDIFSVVFGCKPVAINGSEDLAQLKYNLAEISPYRLLPGFSLLQSLFHRTYRVRILFVDPNQLQVLIGTDTAVSRIQEPFMFDLC